MYSYIAIIYGILIFVFGNAYSAENSTGNSVYSDVIQINDFFDEHLSDFIPVIKQLRFDPMPLPNITNNVSVVHLNLNNGVMYGASNLTRSGDILIKFYKEFWRFQARFHIDELRCEFNYTASTAWGWYKEEGAVNATINNVTVDISTDYSVPTLSLTNPKIHIKDYGLILVNLGTVPSITGVFKSLFVNLALPYFQEHITKIAESTALQIANVTVETVNKNIKNTVKNVDQFLASILGRLTYTPVGNTRPQDIDKVLKPYNYNSITIDSKKNPFRELDKWLASTWNKTALIWNSTSGTQATPFEELDKLLASKITTSPQGLKPAVLENKSKGQQNLYSTGTTGNPFDKLDKWLVSLFATKPYGPKPTVPGKKSPVQQNNYPTGTTGNPFHQLDQWLASLISNKPYSPTLRPIIGGKKPIYTDFLADFNKISHDSWKNTFGDKDPVDVLTDLLEQTSKQKPNNKQSITWGR